MGKVSKTAEMRNKIIEKLTTAFKKLVTENGQAKAPLAALINAGDNPQVLLITIDKKPVTIKFLGGSAISLFSATYKDISVIFRVLSAEEKYVAAYDVLRVNPEVAKHFPERYLLLPFKNRKSSYYLELIEYCAKGSLEQDAEDFDTSLDYSMKMLQQMVDIERAGFRYTDIKPSNFIIADDGRLVLSDIKSLLNVYTESSIPKMEVAQTPIYRSRPTSLSVTPNLDNTNEYSISEIDYKSRYKMGISIYEVITGIRVASNFGNSKKSLFNFMSKQQYELKKDIPTLGLDIQTIQLAVTNLSAYVDQLGMQGPATRLDFNHPAFNSPLGKSVRQVIRGLTHEESSKRLEFSQALLILKLATKKHVISSTANPNSELSSPPLDVPRACAPEKKKHKAKKKASIKMLPEQELASSSASYAVDPELEQTTPKQEKKSIPKLNLKSSQYSHRDLEKHLMFRDKTPQTTRETKQIEEDKKENVSHKRSDFKGKGRASSVAVIQSISKTKKLQESEQSNSEKSDNSAPKYY